MQYFLLNTFWTYLQTNGLLFGIIALALFATIVITWLYARTRQYAEIANLKTQLVELESGFNDKLFKKEDLHKDKLERARLVLSDLRDQIQQQNTPMVIARRNELSNTVALECTKTLYDYIRYAEPFYRDNRYRYHQILENQILPFLQFSGDVLEVLNQPTVLNMVNAVPIQFPYNHFDFAFDALRDYSLWKDFGIKKARNQHAKRLGFAQEV